MIEHDLTLTDRLREQNINIQVENDHLSHILVAIEDSIVPCSVGLISGFIDQAIDIAKQTYPAFNDQVATTDVALNVGVNISGGKDVITSEELYFEIEKVLVEKGAYDIARTIVYRRSGAIPSSNTTGIKVVRRNGAIVPWNPTKIEMAVRKAFLSRHLNPEPAAEIVAAVNKKTIESRRPFVNIEEVQDDVQEELMRAGHYKVAEAYILYRTERAYLRKTGEVPKPAIPTEGFITVVDKNNVPFLWDGADLVARIAYASLGLDLGMSSNDIQEFLKASLSDGLSEEGVRTTVIMNARSLIERNADFAQFSGRILLTYMYEETLDWDILRDGVVKLKQAHIDGFEKYLKRGVEVKRLSPVLLNYDISKLAEHLDPAADLGFDYMGVQTLYDRYLIVDKTNEVHVRLETPQYFWLRVAMGLFIGEMGSENRVIDLYQLYKARRFCSSTPTLFNSGTLHSQLSSCYLYKVNDNIISIFQRGIAENAYLAKWAGGLGGSWTAVRGIGSHIKGTNGESQGVIPFLKVHNDTLVAVNQGGKRKGAGCAYLEIWHNDIEDFLKLRTNTGDERRRTHDMNTANWVPDLFMKRMEAREPWTLFRADETPDLHEIYGAAFEKRYCEYEKMAKDGLIYGKTLAAVDLWKEMLGELFETGHPWITFKDPCNVRSPQDHVGVVHSSNLCTEITLNTGDDETAVCNLGSIVLPTHLNAEGELDHAMLRDTIRSAVRALDNVIDINFYPTDAARTANKRHRPIGLGVMGLADALAIKGISFDSQDAIEFSDEFMEAIAYYAYEMSSDLALEKGKYESYSGSKWDRGLLPQDTITLLEKERGVAIDVVRGGIMDWSPLREKIAKSGMRNSNVLAIAPTATISNIIGCGPCIEPVYKNLYVKDNLGGRFTIMNQYLMRELKRIGLWDDVMINDLKELDGVITNIARIPAEIRQRYATAFDIDWKWIIEAAARRQKWIDQSQSLNLWQAVPNRTSLSRMYRFAWSKGLKTTYYLRTLQASSVKKATTKALSEAKKDEPCESCQ